MKIAICILATLFFSYVRSGSCVAANYCMGCDPLIADKCTSCFNWVKGKVGARSYVTTSSTVQDCKKTLPANSIIADCKIADSTISYAANVKAAGDCVICNKDFKNVDSSTSTLTVACSKTASFTTCKKIKDCAQTVCLKTATTSTHTCNFCKHNYLPTAWSVAAGGATTCTKSTPLANCTGYATSSTAIYCGYCKSKNAVASNSLSCVSFTTDKNCRKLATGNAVCQNCWDAYYWDAAKCKLAAKVVIVGVIMALINFMF